MVGDVQQRIVKMHNELKAQKVSSGLAYSQLLLPENTPTQTYSDSMSLTGSGTGPLARVRFRFTRMDGLAEPPLINFDFTATTSPTYKQFVESKGFTISGDDLDYFDWWIVSGYIGELGDSYVDFYVDFKSSIRSNFFSLNSMSFTVSCQAIANVIGDLSVERII